MGAALTYARRAMRYLRSSVLLVRTTSMRRTCFTEPSPAVAADARRGASNGRKSPNGSIHKPRQPKPLLAIEPSAAFHSELIAEIQQFKDPDDLALYEQHPSTASQEHARRGRCTCGRGSLSRAADPIGCRAGVKWRPWTNQLPNWPPRCRRPSQRTEQGPYSRLWQRKPA